MVSHQSDNPSDAAIIQKVIDGHRDTYEVIMKRYQTHVLGIIKRHVPFDQVEDTVQAVFIRVYQALKSFNQSEPFKPWLTTITLRACYDFWRRQYRNKEVVMSALSAEHRNWLDGVLAEQATKAWRRSDRIEDARHVLQWALSKLSAKDRMVMTLTYLEGYTSQEAGRLLGWSTATIKIRAYRARQKIYKLLIKSKGRS